MPQPEQPLFAAVVFADRGSGVGFVERVRGETRLEANGFTAVTGKVVDRTVAVISPLEARPDFDRLIAAVVAAHRPRLALGAGFSDGAAGEPAGSFAASRVSRADEPTLDLKAPAGEPLPLREFVEQDPGLAVKTGCVQNDWSYAFASACRQHGVPAALVTTLRQGDSDTQSAEAKWVRRQRSTAGRIGAMARAAWRRPASLLELAGQASERWTRQERLADAVQQVIGSL